MSDGLFDLQRRLLSLVSRVPGATLQRLLGGPVTIDGQTLDPIVQLGLALFKRFGDPPLESMSPADARASVRRSMARLRGGVELALPYERTVRVPGATRGLRARWYRHGAFSTPRPVLLYFHGGGHVLCDLDTHEPLCRRLARTSGVDVLSVDYRLAPESPFPAGFNDALAVTRWALSGPEGAAIDPRRLAIGGDSAGGNLSAAVALQLKDHDGGLPPLAFQLLLYPLLDARRLEPSFALFGAGFALDLTTIRWYLDHYLADPAETLDLRASPLLAPSVRGLPPAWVGVAGFDPLRDQGVAWARRLEEAGVPAELRLYPGQIHGFGNMIGVVPAAAAAVDDGARALQEALSGAPPTDQKQSGIEKK